MTTLKESRVTHEEILARTKQLLPAIHERVIEAERMHRQSDEIVKAYVDAGLIRILLPERWGYELPFDTFVDSVLEVAKMDASAGWCYSLLNRCALSGSLSSWVCSLASNGAQGLCI